MREGVPRPTPRTALLRLSPLLLLLAGLGPAGCGARSSLADAAPSPSGGSSSAILFGGTSGDADAGYPDLGETWSWTPSGGWTELHPPTSPSPRFGAAAATLGGDVVLFGGVTETAETAETWLWNGKTWAQAQPSASPPTLNSSVLAPVGQGLALFSGYDNGVLYHDVWQWDGSGWTHGSPPTVPPARDSSAGATVNGALVIFGGEDVDFLPLGDTWSFDGSGWTQLSPAHAPSPRRGAVAAAYDGKMVLFGGDVISPSTQDWLSVDETWVWDGTDWSQMSPSQSPPARSFACTAAVGGKVVLFGGGNFGGSYRIPPAPGCGTESTGPSRPARSHRLATAQRWPRAEDPRLHWGSDARTRCGYVTSAMRESSSSRPPSGTPSQRGTSSSRPNARSRARPANVRSPSSPQRPSASSVESTSRASCWRSAPCSPRGRRRWPRGCWRRRTSRSSSRICASGAWASRRARCSRPSGGRRDLHGGERAPSGGRAVEVKDSTSAWGRFEVDAVQKQRDGIRRAGAGPPLLLCVTTGEAPPYGPGGSAAPRQNFLNEIRAGNGVRTRDPQLGKLMLYQLSYSRALRGRS